MFDIRCKIIRFDLIIYKILYDHKCKNQAFYPTIRLNKSLIVKEPVNGFDEATIKISFLGNLYIIVFYMFDMIKK